MRQDLLRRIFQGGLGPAWSLTTCPVPCIIGSSKCQRILELEHRRVSQVARTAEDIEQGSPHSDDVSACKGGSGVIRSDPRGSAYCLRVRKVGRAVRATGLMMRDGSMSAISIYMTGHFRLVARVDDSRNAP